MRTLLLIASVIFVSALAFANCQTCGVNSNNHNCFYCTSDPLQSSTDCGQPDVTYPHVTSTIIIKIHASKALHGASRSAWSNVVQI